MGVGRASRPWRTYIRALIATLQASAEHDVRAGVSMQDRAATSRIYERLTAVDALAWTHATVDKSEHPRGSLLVRPLSRAPSNDPSSLPAVPRRPSTIVKPVWFKHPRCPLRRAQPQPCVAPSRIVPRRDACSARVSRRSRPRQGRGGRSEARRVPRAEARAQAARARGSTELGARPSEPLEHRRGPGSRLGRTEAGRPLRGTSDAGWNSGDRPPTSTQCQASSAGRAARAAC